jgi:hypothetical protein
LIAILVFGQRRLDDQGQLGGRPGLDRWQNVRIGIQCNPDRRMAQALSNDLAPARQRGEKAARVPRARQIDNATATIIILAAVCVLLADAGRKISEFAGE